MAFTHRQYIIVEGGPLTENLWQQVQTWQLLYQTLLMHLHWVTSNTKATPVVAPLDTALASQCESFPSSVETVETIKLTDASETASKKCSFKLGKARLKSQPDITGPLFGFDALIEQDTDSDDGQENVVQGHEEDHATVKFDQQQPTPTKREPSKMKCQKHARRQDGQSRSNFSVLPDSHNNRC